MNWKLMIMRVLVNGVAIAITVLLLPGIKVVDNRLLTYLILAIALGLLNAFVKPLVQILTLPLLFVTSGLVIVFINTAMLLLLEWLLPELLSIRGLAGALAGGAILGFLGILLENLLGMTPPIIDDVSTPATEV
jgi:putative membrane protein